MKKKKHIPKRTTTRRIGMSPGHKWVRPAGRTFGSKKPMISKSAAMGSATKSMKRLGINLGKFS